MQIQENKANPELLNPQDNEILSDNLHPEAIDHADRFYKAITEQKDVSALIPEILQFIEKYPETPIFTNYITLAYNIVNDSEQRDYWVKESYRRFPTYLFARCAYANYCISHKKLQEVPIIFNNCFNLSLLYKRTHFSKQETLTFYTMLANFHINIGSFGSALEIIKMLSKIFDKHPAIQSLVEQFQVASAEYLVYQDRISRQKHMRKSHKKRK